MVTDEEIFNERIVPKIEGELRRLNGRDYPLQLNLVQLPSNPIPLELDTLKILHQHVDGLKKQANVVNLYLSYYQGLIYLAVRNRSGTNELFVQHLGEKLGVTYRSAQRYISVTLFIKRYPLMLFGGLSHAQILKHLTRLRNYAQESGTFEAPAVFLCGSKKDRIVVTPSKAEFPHLSKRLACDIDSELKPDMESATEATDFDWVLEQENLEALLGFDTEHETVLLTF